MSHDARANVARHLAAMATDRPHALAAASPEGRDRAGRVRYVHLTYRQLDAEADSIALGLKLAGIARGARVAVMVRPGLDFFGLTFGLFRLGAVPVLVDPGIGIKSIGRCLAEAEPVAFLGVAKAQLARKVLGWARETVKIAITAGPKGSEHGLGTLDQVRRRGAEELRGRPFDPAPTSADESAAILFTSGSTGPPKGAVYSHANFEEQVRLLRSTYGIEPGEVDLCTFPLFALFAPALGMAAIVPEMDASRPGRADPARLVRAIEDWNVTNLFGSPALIRRLADHGMATGARLPTLRRAISAGAPVPAAVVERFAAMLAPGTPIHTPYGATEALPVCTIASDEILGETRARTEQGAGVCVGRPVEGIRVELIRVIDGPISTWSDGLLAGDGEVGEIAVQGPVVTRSYFNRPEATALAKIDEPGGVGFWHRMGDLGRRDEQGRIWFCGRKSQRVNTPAGPLDTIPIEAIFNAHPEVARTALVGVKRRGVVHPVLCVEPIGRPGPVEREEIRRGLRALAAKHPGARDVETFRFHRRFPVDVRHNAKIGREALARWAARPWRQP